MRPPAEFETARLHLRAPRIEDADAIFREYAADSEVTRYMIWVPHESVDSVREFLKTALQHWEDGTEFSWVIKERTGSGAIGMISTGVRAHKVGIGYVLARRCWNRGYMTEVVSAVSDWLLSQSGVYRVWAVCDIENIGSARALEKSGFDCEGTLRRWIVLPNCANEPRDCYMYARTR